jgi:hypothetical protein
MKTTIKIALGAALALSLAVVVATGASAAKKPPKLTAADQALFQYAACMRKKGVKIPDPVRGKNGTYAFPKISDKILKAPGVKKKAQACAAQLPNRRVGPATAAQQAAFKKFSDCMAKNGVKVKRPTNRPVIVTGPPNGQQPGAGSFFNTKDPKVKKALAKCRKYLPQPRQVQRP